MIHTAPLVDVSDPQLAVAATFSTWIVTGTESAILSVSVPVSGLFISSVVSVILVSVLVGVAVPPPPLPPLR
jgi:hypothetical protein